MNTAAVETLAARLQQCAARDPDGEAFEWYVDDRRRTIWSRDNLYRRACAQAARIAAHAPPASRIVLALPQGLPFIAAFFGCHYARCTAVPVYPPDSSASLPRLLRIFADCEPALLITSPALAKKLEVTGLALPPRLLLDDELVQARAEQPPLLPMADDLALLQYTSGTTATPKGVMISQRNLVANGAAITTAYAPDPGATAQARPRVLSWLPFFHDMGLIGGICYPVYAGIPATLLATSAFLRRPALWPQLIAARRATISPAPNFAYDLCARRIDDDTLAALDLSCWQSAICGSERVRRDTVERFLQHFANTGFDAGSFRPSYGMAETTLLVSATSAAPHFSAPAPSPASATPAAFEHIDHASCGAPVAAEVRIVDPERHHPCSDGDSGEIWVRSASVGLGYWRQPALTAQQFQARLANGDGPWLRTGDLGFMRNGELYVTGRLRELIILRGRNYLPQDIEGVVRETLPELAAGQCAAFAVERDGSEALVVALEVPPRRCDGQLAQRYAADIRIALRSGLAVDPDEVLLVRLNSLPRTTSGKLRRGEIRARYLARQLDLLRPAQAS